jgi:hypothetical protein
MTMTEIQELEAQKKTIEVNYCNAPNKSELKFSLCRQHHKIAKQIADRKQNQHKN